MTSATNAGASNASPATHEAQAYIDDMARKCGYVLDYHKIIAKQDFRVPASNQRTGELGLP